MYITVRTISWDNDDLAFITMFFDLNSDNNGLVWCFVNSKYDVYVRFNIHNWFFAVVFAQYNWIRTITLYG